MKQHIVKGLLVFCVSLSIMPVSYTHLAYRSGLAGEEALAAIGRQLSIFCTDNAKIYLALFANDFATSLAYLSFAAAAEMFAENMGEDVYKRQILVSAGSPNQ